MIRLAHFYFFPVNLNMYLKMILKISIQNIRVWKIHNSIRLEKRLIFSRTQNKGPNSGD